MDNGKVFFSKNGTFQNSGVPTSGANPAFSSLSGTFAFAVGSSVAGDAYTLNAGQRSFNTAAPAGFLSLNTANLPEPTIADGSKYFDSTIYTGNGSGQTITLTNSGFSPDWVWIKSRNQSANHWLVDVVRGADQRLITSGTQAEASGGSSVVSFTSTGFVLGTDSFSSTNENNDTYVAWTWDGGTSTVTNNDGSITSQVRAQPSAGFSIVSYNSGSSAGNYTLGHGLNSAPQFIIHKSRSTSNWWVFHSSVIDNTAKYLQLNGTAAIATNSAPMWGAALPTSSVFGVRVGDLIGTNQDAIAYCFAPVNSYSAMGSYVGNGNADGPFVALSFRPAFVLTKASSAGGNWQIIDSTRSDFNLANDKLWPSQNYDENSATLGGAGADNIDILSNGFKLKTNNAGTNGSGVTYIYYAVAENSFQANGGLAR